MKKFQKLNGKKLNKKEQKTIIGGISSDSGELHCQQMATRIATLRCSTQPCTADQYKSIEEEEYERCMNIKEGTVHGGNSNESGVHCSPC